MLHQLHGRLANDQSLLREGEEKRLAGFALLLSSLRGFFLVDVDQRDRRFRTVEFGIARRHEDDLAVPGQEIDRLLIPK